MYILFYFVLSQHALILLLTQQVLTHVFHTNFLHWLIQFCSKFQVPIVETFQKSWKFCFGPSYKYTDSKVPLNILKIINNCFSLFGACFFKVNSNKWPIQFQLCNWFLLRLNFKTNLVIPSSNLVCKHYSKLKNSKLSFFFFTHFL